MHESLVYELHVVLAGHCSILTYQDSFFDEEKTSFIFCYSAAIAKEQALSGSKLDRLGVFLESLKPFGKGFSVLERKGKSR